MSDIPPEVEGMARAVIARDLAAAMGLQDWLMENRRGNPEPAEIMYLYDNGQSYSDWSISWIAAPASIPQDEVERLILGGRTEASIPLRVYAGSWKEGEGYNHTLWGWCISELPGLFPGSESCFKSRWDDVCKDEFDREVVLRRLRYCLSVAPTGDDAAYKYRLFVNAAEAKARGLIESEVPAWQ